MPKATTRVECENRVAQVCRDPFVPDLDIDPITSDLKYSFFLTSVVFELDLSLTRILTLTRTRA